MVIGRTRLYADENIEVYLVDFIRGKGCKVDYAIELGFSPREAEDWPVPFFAYAKRYRFY